MHTTTNKRIAGVFALLMSTVLMASALAIPLGELRSQEAERRNIEAALKAYQKLPHPSREADKADKTIDRMLHHYIAGQQQDIQFCKRELAHAEADERADIAQAIAKYQSNILWAQRIVQGAAAFNAIMEQAKQDEAKAPHRDAISEEDNALHGHFRVAFNPHGNATNIQMISSTGKPSLDKEAIELLSSAKTEPSERESHELLWVKCSKLEDGQWNITVDASRPMKWE